MPTIPDPLYDPDGLTSLAVYEYLEKATPEERTEIVLRLIDEHPHGVLSLHPRYSKRPNLSDIDLGSSMIGEALSVRGWHGEDFPKWVSWNTGVDKLHSGTGANLCGAYLSGALLNSAHLDMADLRKADLRGADLRKANLWSARLQNANLQGARLEEAALADADLGWILVSDAWLDRTCFVHTQLNGAIGEELREQYEFARNGYRRLKQNFESLGDYEGAAWAYCKERRMEKKEAWARKHYGKAIFDQVVEWVCDYGEGWRNIIGCIAFFWIFFALLYGLSGYVLTPGTPEATTISASTAQQGGRYAVTHNILHWLVFSLATMVTIELPALRASSDPVMSALMPLQAFIGIFLAGLLGFVAGNRIRRS